MLRPTNRIAPEPLRREIDCRFLACSQRRAGHGQEPVSVNSGNTHNAGIVGNLLQHRYYGLQLCKLLILRLTQHELELLWQIKLVETQIVLQSPAKFHSCRNTLKKPCKFLYLRALTVVVSRSVVPV